MDGSGESLGYTLVRPRLDGGKNFIKCNSVGLTDAQKNYAPIEIEKLSYTWAIKDCKQYLLGCPMFTVYTDHRPLCGIERKLFPEVDNSRILRMSEKTLGYNYIVKYIPGDKNFMPDI